MTKKKEIKYLNVCMDKALYEELDQFCKKYGMSKVGVTETAIRLYMKRINNAMEANKAF